MTPSIAGWMREDLCTAGSADAGSHYVCVNMPSDFWVKTGQATSAADAAANWPKPGPWCICMWCDNRMLLCVAAEQNFRACRGRPKTVYPDEITYHTSTHNQVSRSKRINAVALIFTRRFACTQPDTRLHITRGRPLSCRAYANYLAQHPEFSSSLICDATNSWVLKKCAAHT